MLAHLAPGLRFARGGRLRAEEDRYVANERDQFGLGWENIVPVVADGKVFVGGRNSVAVFGLLP